MIDQLSSILISSLSGGGFTAIIAAILYRNQNRRLKESEAKLAEISVYKGRIEAQKENEERLLRQIDHQQESIDKYIERLANVEDKHEQEKKEWNEKDNEKTQIIRNQRKEIVSALEREKEYIRREGLLLRRIQYLISFVCKRTDCDHGIPPRQHLLGCTFDESQIEDAEREKEITIDLTKS